MANQAASHDALVGQTLGHYRVIEKIGAGGMGEVYRAHDEHLDRDAAIKVLPPQTFADESARKHFRKEALALSKLNHPNIATIHDFDTQQGVDFLVMEYIPGLTLSEKLATRPLPEKEVIALGAQLAEGLFAAHEHGVVHRDLKPGNLRLTDDGRLKILDFGLAKLRFPVTATAATESLSKSQAIAGTLSYMAPEQLLGGEIDARTDIHAAGSVLYEMATGQHPFDGVEHSQLIGAILRRPPLPPTTLNPRLSPEMERIIAKCLEKEPENRYQSAKELAIDLRRLLTPSAAKVAGVPVAGGKLWKVLVPAALILVAAAIGGALYVNSRRAHALTDRDTIVLSDFDNRTGDGVFDGTLRQGLAVQLEQSPFLSLVSEERIQQTLRLMDQPPDAKLTPQIARKVCQRTESVAVLDGTIAGLGSQYVIGLKAVNCRTGDSLANEQVTAASKEQVLRTLGEAAAKLRGKLGESLNTVQKFDTPLEEATTPSLEALQAYSLGQKTMVGKGDYVAALPFFQRAISLDPNFSMAYAALGTSYFNLGETGLAAENTRKAYELRDRVSDREKFYIESHYYHYVSGDLEKARRAYELWAQTYPRDDEPHTGLGILNGTLGQYDKMLTQSREALRLDPGSGLSYANLVLSYFFLNRLQEAQGTAEEARTKKVDSPFLHDYLYDIAFLQNDAAGMAEQVDWSTGRSGVEDWLLYGEADTATYSGHLREALEFSRRAVASAEQAEEKETAAEYEADASLQLALFGNGNSADAQQRTKEALGLSNGRYVQYGAALALAFAGDANRSQSLADDLAERFPEDTIVQFHFLPTIRAQLSLIHKDSSKALDTLQAAIPYELGAPSYEGALIINLYPVYVRGQAHLAAHQGSEAAAEFQKILDHRGVVGNEPLGALARLGLARAYAMQGDTANARATYQDFLTLWKDADADIPILKQAKAEYARLQ